MGSKQDKIKQELLDTDAIGIGVLIKVKENCQLGVQATTTPSPPQLPE